MREDEAEFRPARRTADLVVRAQHDETLVLDTRSDRVHCLPAEATRVWEACTGGRTMAEVATAAGLDAALAASSVDQLADLDLLGPPPAGVDRRRFLRRSVLVGGSALALPVIQTVLAPAAFAGCSTNQIILTQGGQDSCTGNAAHAKYTITISGCSPNTDFYPLLSYNSDVGPAVETVKTLTTDGSGNASTQGNGNLTNEKIHNGSSTVTLTLYADKNHTIVVGSTTALFTIVCP
jgi:hypothetical protein